MYALSVSSLQDPSYPVYVDTSVMSGNTGDYNTESSGFDGVEYMVCNPDNSFFPDLSKIGRTGATRMPATFGRVLQPAVLLLHDVAFVHMFEPLSWISKPPRCVSLSQAVASAYTRHSILDGACAGVMTMQRRCATCKLLL